MSERVTMRPRDSVRGSAAEGFITIDGRRYSFLQMINFESKIEISNGELPILGKVMKGHKPGPATGTWSATVYYNQSIMRQAVIEYIKTGVFPYFEIQVTNEDPSSAAGRQTSILKDCLIDGSILSKFDADTEFLDEEISGTFDDAELPEKFNLLTGM